MYHRFEENKYPSTNIKNEIFSEHLKEINNLGIEFIKYKKFEEIIKIDIDKNYLLLTIDDAFESFYLNAWPVLKNKKIPFILFVSTREIGKHGYMTWDQIKEVDASNLVTIGNHSHSHEYLVDWKDDEIKHDLENSIKIFKKKLGYSPTIFSYPFGEYSSNLKKIVKNLGFKYAFGQHSGVIDQTKDFLELPRFPINEKYGDIKRFNNLIKYLPLQYKSIKPKNKFLTDENNPPEMVVEFFKEQENIENINCFSNEGNKWRNSRINITNNILKVYFYEKFNSSKWISV